MAFKKIFRFCDGEIVDGLNRKHYNTKKEDDMQCICTTINALINQLNILYGKNSMLEKENEQLKQLNIPVNEIKDTVVDYKSRIIGVYYND